jgi:hypothetical protein
LLTLVFEEQLQGFVTRVAFPFGKLNWSAQNSGGTVAGRTENLKPWPKGVSGNPKGRPKEDISAELARAIFENNAEAIYRAMAHRLIKGDVRAFKILAERAYGKVKEQVTSGLPERLQAARQRMDEFFSDAEFGSQANEPERQLGIPNVSVRFLNSADVDVAERRSIG